MPSPLRLLAQSTLILAYGLLFFGSSAQAQTLTREWDRTLGNAGKNRLNRMRPTTDGGYILGAQTDPEPGGDVSEKAYGVIEYWVVKLDAQGKKQWDRVLGGTEDEYVTDIQQTTDGGYIVGGWSRSGANGTKSEPSRGNDDYWVVKLDAQGRTQWERTLGGSSSDVLEAIVQTPDGGYMALGSSSSPASGDKTQSSSGPWFVKLDAQGRKQWDRTILNTAATSKLRLLLTPDGGYMLGSSVNIPATPTQPNHSDYRLMKLTGNLEKQWEKTFGGTEQDFLTTLEPTADQGYLLGGTSYSGASGQKAQGHLGAGDYWVVKTDAMGNLQWERTLATSQRDNLASARQLPDGGYLIGGSTSAGISGNKTQPSQGGEDFWVVRLTKTGAVEWDKGIGGSDVEDLTDAFPTPDGGYIFGGSSLSGSSGDKTAANLGVIGTDIWLLKLQVAPPTLQILGAAPLCSSGQVVLTASHNSSTPAVAYQWSTGATTSSITVTQPGTYTLTATFAGGLTSTTQQQIVAFTATLHIMGAPVLCAGVAPLALQAQDPAATSFRWNTGATTAGISVNQPGTYSVVASYAGGCTATSTHIVSSAPTLPPFTFGPDTTLCEGHALVLRAPVSTPASATYRWSDGSTGPSLLVQQPGEYSLQIATACATVTASRRISAKPCLTLPNVITPNNDQHNDYWAVHGLIGQWSLTIYNRWGRTVYTTEAYRNNWGSEAARGVYYYLLRQPATGATYKGWIQVL